MYKNCTQTYYFNFWFFSKTLRNPSTLENVVNLCLVLMKNWDHVQSYVKKGESDKNKDGIDERSKSMFQSAQALADMAFKNYHAAAQKFLQLKFDVFNYRKRFINKGPEREIWFNPIDSMA